MQRSRRIVGSVKATWSLVGSLAVHALLLGGLGWAAYRSMADNEAESGDPSDAASGLELIAVDLPAMGAGSLLMDHDAVPEGEEPSRFGGAAIARLDTGAAGAGGDATGARATNLAALDDRMQHSMDVLSRLDRDQVQRLKTGARRTTREDRRATTNPMELTFLATGKGHRPERRPWAEKDPSRGSLVARSASVAGGRPGANEAEAPAPGLGGAPRAGELRGSPGLGVRDGRKAVQHRKPARIAYARPLVTEGPPTIPGIWNGRPRDTVDSEQEVASTVQSLIHASFAGGLAGKGAGGSASVFPDPGAGGGRAGRGSVSRPLGSGDGDLVDWNTDDPMLLSYFRKVHAKVNPLWANAFPKSALLELKQGTVILEITISADGTAKVGWPPLRPSGIDEFDRNCAEAVRRASPFDPLPEALRQHGRTKLRVRAPFVAKNPIVK